MVVFVILLIADSVLRVLIVFCIGFVVGFVFVVIVVMCYMMGWDL